VKDSRPVLKDIAISLAVLAFITSGFLVWTSLIKNRNSIISSYGNEQIVIDDKSAEAVESRPESDIQDTGAVDTDNVQKEDDRTVLEKEAASIDRYVVKKHVVVGGESFSLITGMYWDDIFLWPDLYVHNNLKSEDPDLIYPDEIVDIYNRLGNGDNFSDAEKKLILDAYIEVYKRYKAIGPEKNHSAWTLLWCGAKYDHDFLEKYSDCIDPADKAVAQKYINEEGFLD
jgi:hypothetical protein